MDTQSVPNSDSIQRRPRKLREVRPVEERFLAKVRKSIDPDECWIWIGARDTRGYGIIGSPRGQRPRNMGAHRLSWELANNSTIPEDKRILHSCDNPSCVNPNHLRLGTAKDNTQDMLAKDRYPVGDRHYARKYPMLVRRGETSHCAKITEKDVQMARYLSLVHGASTEQLALRLGINIRTCRDMLNGATWAHVKDPLPQHEADQIPLDQIKSLRIHCAAIGLNENLMEKVDEFKTRFQFKTRTDALRCLIEFGLQHNS